MLDEERMETEKVTSESGSTVALACGVLGVLAAVWVYWLVVPAVVFGLAAVILGLRTRRNGSPERGSVAVALGIVALLVLPSVMVVVDAESDYARDCALNPTDPDC